MALSVAVTTMTTRPITMEPTGSLNISARGRTRPKAPMRLRQPLNGLTPIRASDLSLWQADPMRSYPHDGARLKVRITQGPKGPQVAEVVEVDASTAQVPSRAEGRTWGKDRLLSPPPIASHFQIRRSHC